MKGSVKGVQSGVVEEVEKEGVNREVGGELEGSFQEEEMGSGLRVIRFQRR